MTETLELHHSFDAKLARNIGEQSVSSSIQAVNELIKNSYDADSTKCKVRFFAKSQRNEFVDMEKIVIEDDGFGMTFEDIVTKWMRVATSFKEREILSPVLHRRVSGEKGMGRFSSQRLGNKIKIISNPEDYVGRKKSSKGTNTLVLTVDWNKYTAGKDFEKIPNILKILDTIEDPGFKIEITDLKGSWVLDDIDNIMINAGTLISPEILRKSEENSFDVEVICHNFSPKRALVESVIEKYAPFEIRAQLRGSKVNYQISTRNPGKDEGRKPASDISKRAKSRGDFSVGSKTCGDANITLLAYGERPGEWAPKSVQKFSELNTQLEENCGIKIFNDGVRIMPYGKKGNDWMGLDKRWLIRAGGKLRNRNVIGYVFLTREKNDEIIETMTREALIENNAFKFLKERFVLGVLEELEKYREEVIKEKKSKKRQTRPSAIASFEIKQLTDFIKTLKLEKIDKDETVKKLQIINKFVEQQHEETKKLTEVSTSKIEMYRNLASLGISALAFHHEIRQYVGRINEWLRLLLADWKELEDSEKRDYVTESQDDVLTIIDLNKYIREFAALFSGLKGTRRKREEIGFQETVNRFTSGFKKLLKKDGIEIECVMGPGHFNGLYMNRASWESIMLNLLSNSIKALNDVDRQSRKIRVTFDKTEANLKIRVHDNGKGIEQSNFERIFDPLWTSYKSIENPGTGMGLTIVKEIIEDDYGGDVSVESSKYEKDYPGKGETTIQILIPLDKLREKLT